MKTLGLVAALLAVGATTLTAQVNTERLRRTPANTGLLGSAGVDFTARTGNVSLVLFNLKGRVDFVRRRWLTFLVGAADVGWKDGQRFSNSGLLHLRYNYDFTPRVIGELFTQVDYDKARLLDFRNIAGFGPRLILLERNGWTVAFGTDYMYEHEQYVQPTAPGASPLPDENTSRWSNYLTMSGGVGHRVATVVTTYAQPRFDDFGDIRVLADGRVSVQLVGSLSLTVSSTVRYDSRPPGGIRSVDTTIESGVSVEW